MDRRAQEDVYSKDPTKTLREPVFISHALDSLAGEALSPML